jgi:tetratricopeptide (TPR) repeat protein
MRQVASTYLLGFFLLASANVTSAQEAAPLAQQIQSAALRGAVDELTNLQTQTAAWAKSSDAEQLYVATLAQFRLLQTQIIAKRYAQAERSGTDCTASAANAARAFGANAALAGEAWALQSVCYGYIAGVGGTFAAIRNGRASGRAMEQALALAPRNPRVVLVDALGLYFRPKIAGGDKAKACNRFAESTALFQVASDSGVAIWGRAEAHFWRGRCLREAGDTMGANKEFAQALKIAPDFAAARRFAR